MSYFAFFVVLIIAFYTVMFGIDIWKEKNHLGSLAIISLALVATGLPFYILFLRS